MRRTFAAMLAVLAASLGLCAGGTLILRRTAEDMEKVRMALMDAAAADRTEEAAELVTRMADLWAGREPLLETVATHDDLHTVSELIIEADASLSANDPDDFIRAVRLLGMAVNHLLAGEAFRLGNIL